jgi:hypothetical protein
LTTVKDKLEKKLFKDLEKIKDEKVDEEDFSVKNLRFRQSNKKQKVINKYEFSELYYQNESDY